MKKIIIIGGGIGGLTAAVYLKKKGVDVLLLEAGSELGGLAKSEEFAGHHFDAGPYILLDKPGLVWAFQQLDTSFEEQVSLHLIEQIYSVNKTIQFDKDLEVTVNRFNDLWKGQGDLYRDFVLKTGATYQKLNPYTYMSHPTPWHLLKNMDLGLMAFMASTLGKVLHKYKLNDELVNAVGIWTHVASQALHAAPSPMAFVPSLFHLTGSYYPIRGMGSIARALENMALNAGVEIRKNTPVQKILVQNQVVQGVELADGTREDATVVLSNMSAVGTYRHLLDHVPAAYSQYLDALPLQSPGFCIYLKVKNKAGSSAPYLQFQLNKDIPTTVAFVNPSFLGYNPSEPYHSARLIAPLPHHLAEKMSREEEMKMMFTITDQEWWRENLLDFEITHYRTSKDWGKDFHLYRNSMNPVMTAAFMRKGRIAHQSKYFKGLYFCGSSTHPGQWISFCSVSGILASQKILQTYA